MSFCLSACLNTEVSIPAVEYLVSRSGHAGGQEAKLGQGGLKGSKGARGPGGGGPGVQSKHFRFV